AQDAIAEHGVVAGKDRRLVENGKAVQQLDVAERHGRCHIDQTATGIVVVAFGTPSAGMSTDCGERNDCGCKNTGELVHDTLLCCSVCTCASDEYLRCQDMNFR